eukprot:5200168-Prymnesium_polylepis.1
MATTCGAAAERPAIPARSGGVQCCACAWIACARGNGRVSEEQGARRTGVRLLAHALHARTHVCTSSWRKASSL